MSDLIDRQALKNKICDCCEGKDEWCNGPCFEIMIIDSMPAIAAYPWHRVEEKPAKEEECLTVSVDGHIEVNWWSNSWGWLHDADNIEWWMPLPEPPKEDE